MPHRAADIHMFALYMLGTSPCKYQLQAYAPINCLPHLPHTLTHISCNGPTPWEGLTMSNPPPTPYLAPIMRGGDYRSGIGQ